MTNSEKNSSGQNENLSAFWKEKFKTLDKIPNQRMRFTPDLEGLTFKERLKVAFNIWAFIFGPIYYFLKKLWVKGLLLFSFQLFYILFLDLFTMISGQSLSIHIYWAPPAAMYAIMANVDYYKYKTLNETLWPGFPNVFKNQLVITIFVVIPLAMQWALYDLTPEFKNDLEAIVLQDITESLQEDNIRVNDFQLVRIGKNKYQGILYTNEDDGTYTYYVDVVSDGDYYSWSMDEGVRNSSSSESEPVESEPRITLEQFEALQIGMTLEEVNEILGVDCELKSEMGEIGSPTHTAAYVCMEGEGLEEVLFFMIQGGELLAKSQAGLR